MRARPCGGMFVVCLDNLSRPARESLSPILAQAKFVQAILMTGMAGDIPACGIPPDCEVHGMHAGILIGGAFSIITILPGTEFYYSFREKSGLISRLQGIHRLKMERDGIASLFE